MPLTYARSSRAAPIAPLLAPFQRVSFLQLPLLLIFQYWQYSIHLSSLTSWRFPQKTKSWQSSAAGWSIFRNPRNLHARENWWNKTVKPRNGTLANLWTLHLLTNSYVYIYIFFFSREMVEYFRSPRIVRRFFMYIYPRYSVAIILYALWIWIWIFKLRRSITRISYKIPINLSHHAYSHRVNS